LVSYARLTGKLSLSDEAGADFPPLRGTRFDDVRLVNLGTYTAGGLPLQFPDDVKTDDDAIRYYQRWRPLHPAGTYRLYSNPSIMLLGLIAAKTMHSNFTMLMRRDVFAPLGLRRTFLVIPSNVLSSYAQGYTDADKPRRMSLGPLALEAYGIRTTAPDMLDFIDANMNLVQIDGTLRRAIIETHSGYYGIGALTQDLIWEQYRYPISLAALLQGNSEGMLFDEQRVRAIDPPSRPTGDVWINKTGSTNGFAAYVAFVPKKMTGIVLLANKSYPIEARVTAAYRILAHLNETSNDMSSVTGLRPRSSSRTQSVAAAHRHSAGGMRDEKRFSHQVAKAIRSRAANVRDHPGNEDVRDAPGVLARIRSLQGRKQ
jgi:beta-lactamase class C